MTVAPFHQHELRQVAATLENVPDVPLSRGAPGPDDQEEQEKLLLNRPAVTAPSILWDVWAALLLCS